MKTATAKTAFTLTFITGALLVFIGARFLLLPRVAELAFGIDVNTGSNFSFHYIKGIRDLSVGIAILALLFARNWQGLGIVLLVASLVPVADFLIVLNTPGHLTARLYPHATAVVLGLVLGAYYLYAGKRQVRAQAGS
ncbi:DUF4267 domain-containing protein [Deminuibacter soli]|uniref:DUF4267 domain-containing protein n=1 Tax=Deminuibacter soli TaxID=2291815 RepID=A0A3E1NP98_9BACT|nr:DUF4267 domain-containing protein [Deminuibacter soli]RFM29740.1 DUF4267 domain-containing protein [Deminuibacter soli]